MLVNFTPALIFIKTFKTASTTTEAVLQQALWGEPTEHAQDWFVSRSGLCTPRVGSSSDLSVARELGVIASARLPISAIGRIRRLRNHASPHAIRRAVGERFWNRSLKIVNVRNPFDTEVSAYFFRFRNRPESRRPSFTQWIDEKAVTPRNRWVDNIDSTWRLIRFESLETDISSVLRELERDSPASLPAYKSGIRPTEARDYRSMYTPTTQAKVEAMYGNYLNALSYEF